MLIPIKRKSADETKKVFDLVIEFDKKDDCELVVFFELHFLNSNHLIPVLYLSLIIIISFPLGGGHISNLMNS